MNQNLNIIKVIFIIIFSIFFPFSELVCQIKGEPPVKLPVLNPDTTFIFKSPRPLIDPTLQGLTNYNAWGIDVNFSENGVGFGAFWGTYFYEDLLAYIGLYASGARNTDEFESYDPSRNEYRVYNKINRLYMFPLMLGVQKFIFQDVLTETLQPYVSIGAGPTFIVATPYEREFFNAIHYAKTYVRLGVFGGIGAYVGNFGTSLMGINLRYYYIPFGGNGLESVRNSPIQNFGGIFISLSLGTKY